MDSACDVNIILIYANSNHARYKKVCSYLNNQFRKRYILLAKVKNNFIFTYKRYLSDSCLIIDKAIRDYRKERKTLEKVSTSYKPSLLSITTNIRENIKQNMEEYSQKYPNYSSDGVKFFVNELLVDYSIPRLYAEERLLGEFRERYLHKAEEASIEVLNRFLHKFTAGFELVNIEEYKHYRDILDKLKVMKKGVFYNKNEYVRTDFEDMTIAAEYLSFNYEKKKIDFFTTDNNMRKSLIIVSKELDIKVGKINCL